MRVISVNLIHYHYQFSSSMETIVMPHLVLFSKYKAYHQNKVYPLYVFITLGWYTDGWWDSSTVNCTRHQMEIALNRSLAMTLDPQIKDTNMTTSSRLVT